MATNQKYLISIVVPVYNEQDGLRDFHASLLGVMKKLRVSYEIIYCDDGSTDGSATLLQSLAKRNKNIRVLRLSRNFGKEIATTAGLHAAKGHAILTIDADGQHPADRIPEFIQEWQSGAKVIIGVRTTNQKEGFIKRYGSRLFYGIFSKAAGIKMVPGSSDFRLIDQAVQEDFAQLTEHNRITRGLIDWLGHESAYITYAANPRFAGKASYSVKKLFKLAIDSAISLSISPLYITAYIGAFILPLSALLGIGMLVNALLGDPLTLNASGSAYMMVFMLFLIGIVLVSQGIIGLYLSHIHTETQNRPLYIVDKKRSLRV